MTVEQVRADREARERRAAERAKDIPPGEYHAYDNFVVCNRTYETVVECETHWDACLVLIAIGGNNGAK